MARESIFRTIFHVHGFRDSLRFALRGVVYLFFYHRNMRIIFLFGVAAFLAGILYHLKGIELVALCITITLVLMAEIFNTAVELLMNMLTEKYHTKIRVIKDISAGIVVITSLNAIGVGFILFAKRIFG